MIRTFAASSVDDFHCFFARYVNDVQWRIDDLSNARRSVGGLCFDLNIELESNS